MRRFLRNLPIKHKLMALTVAISGVALLLACAVFAIYEQAVFRRAMARDFAILADMFDDNVAAGLAFNDPAAIELTLKTLSANQRIVAACVYDKQGAVIATYRRPGVLAGAGFKFPPVQPTGQRWGADRLDTFENIELAGEIIGVVYIGVELGELRERAWRYAGIVGLLLAGCSLVALGLSSRLQRIVSQPIVDLAQTVAAVTTGKDYAVRAHKESDDELGRLIDGFNEMLTQIQARDSALGSARDTLEQRVTERTAELASSLALLKQAKEAAAREQARFKFIFDALPVGISWFVPYRDETHLTNPAHERITGVSAAEALITGAFARASHPDDYRRQVALTQPFVTGEVDHYSVEKRYLHRDGRTVWALLTSRMFTDPATGEKQAVTTLVDITERKDAELALQESEERFSGAFEFAPIGVALVAPDGRWLKVNRALCDLVGYSAAELLTRTFQEITYAADLAGDLAHMQRLLAGEISSYQMEKRYVHAHGALIPVLLNVSLVRDDQGRPRYFISQIQDISGRKQAEVKLAETHQQLLDTSRKAGMAEVATGVLHNVGNVLNSVNVSATVVAGLVRHSKAGNVAKLAALLDEHKSDLAGFLTRDARGQVIPRYLATLAESLTHEQAAMVKELDDLRKNIEHIKDIVGMQQSFARNAGFIETVDLTEIVEDALRMNASSLARHEVELVREFQPQPAISTDKHKIVQILINLVRNAKHACDASGRADKRITVRIAGDAAWVRIAVSDNGIGIPAENLTRVFNHGFTTKKDGHGFGLHSGALAAKELGGALSVQSGGPGLGTTFTLELPRKSPLAHDERPVS